MAVEGNEKSNEIQQSILYFIQFKILAKKQTPHNFH